MSDRLKKKQNKKNNVAQITQSNPTHAGRMRVSTGNVIRLSELRHRRGATMRERTK